MSRAITNNTKSPIYEGNRMIMPGDTQVFPDLPAPPAPAAAAVDDDIAAIQKFSVKDIVHGLPALPDADLDRLEALENASATPRKSLFEALAHERLARANAKQDTGDQ